MPCRIRPILHIDACVRDRTSTRRVAVCSSCHSSPKAVCVLAAGNRGDLFAQAFDQLERNCKWAEQNRSTVRRHRTDNAAPARRHVNRAPPPTRSSCTADQSGRAGVLCRARSRWIAACDARMYLYSPTIVRLERATRVQGEVSRVKHRTSENVSPRGVARMLASPEPKVGRGLQSCE
jgi:hypothetical protein